MKKIVIAAVLLLFGAAWYTTVRTAVEEPMKYQNYLKEAARYEKEEIYYDAILAYQKALEVRPGSMELRLKMAEDYKQLGDGQGFENACSQAISMSSQNEEAIFMLADYYVETGRKADAVSLLKYQAKNKKDNEAVLAKLRTLAGGYEYIGGEYDLLSDACSGYMLAKTGEAYGILDSQGSELIRAEYDAIGLFGENGFAPVQKDGQWYYIDKNNYKRRVPEGNYEFLGVCNQGMIPAGRDGKWGYLDEDLREKTEFVYDEATPFLKGLAAVRKGEKWALINSKMEEITDYGFDDIVRDEWGFCSRNGVVFAKTGDAYVLLDSSGVQVTDETYEAAKPFLSDQPAAVKQAGKWGFIDSDGKKTLECIFEKARSFSEIGYAPVCSGELWGYVRSNGDFVIEPEFDDVRAFNGNGIAPVKRGEVWQLIQLDIY